MHVLIENARTRITRKNKICGHKTIRKEYSQSQYLSNLGSITGCMTFMPALGTLIHVPKAEDVAAANAAAYSIAWVAVLLVSQFIVILFS